MIKDVLILSQHLRLKFSYVGNDGEQIRSVVDRGLKEMGDWSDKWLMSFNHDKT